MCFEKSKCAQQEPPAKQTKKEELCFFSFLFYFDRFLYIDFKVTMAAKMQAKKEAEGLELMKQGEKA